MKKNTRLDASIGNDEADNHTRGLDTTVPLLLKPANIQPSMIIYDPDARIKYGEPDFYVEIEP
jgi:hypothetical protein